MGGDMALGPPGPYRLVIYADTPPTASVFALDATAFAPPLATMGLSPRQALPVLESGGVVHASANFHELTVGDTVIRPVGRVVKVWPGTQGRIFAERGNVIVHPDTPGHPQTWRSATPESGRAVEQFTRRARRDVTAVVALVVMVVAVTVAPVTVAPVIAPGRPAWWWGLSGGFAGTVLLGRRARRSLAALKHARSTLAGPATPMLMRLYWAVGHGRGPVAVASLRPMSAPAGAGIEVEVVGVPTGPFPQNDVVVDVFGVGDESGVGVIQWGTTQLWPISQSSAPASL